MYPKYLKLAMGVDWGGGAFNLVALARGLRQFVLVDALQLLNPREEEAPSKVAEFLERNRLREVRVAASVPRDAVLVRFLDLPAEAEPQLAKVVGYQIDALHPFQDAQIYWDCTVVSRDAKSRQIRVMVVLAEKSRLESYQEVLTNLGLKVHSLTLAAATLAPMLKPLLPESALVVVGRAKSVELLAFHQGGLCSTQEVPIEPGQSACERFQRELHNALSVLPGADPAALPVYVSGPIPPSFLELTPNRLELPEPKLQLVRPRGLDLRSHVPALAAAYSGLVRKLEPSINLLPPEQRWQPSRGARVPLYAMGTVAAVLALVVAAHGWIGRALYGRALDREVRRLESPAKQVQRQSQEVSSLSARAALLDGLRLGTRQKLEILQELTKRLPDGTWLQQVQLGEETLEINGYSNRAADLVPPLENSPFFSQVEFTSPITRDSQNKELFWIRMRLRRPAGPLLDHNAQ